MAKAATSSALAEARTPASIRSGSPTASFGPQLRGFDIRGVGPRVQRIPYKDDGTLRSTRPVANRPTRLAARLITWAGSNSRFPTSARHRGAWACARRRSSTSARCGISPRPRSPTSAPSARRNTGRRRRRASASSPEPYAAGAGAAVRCRRTTIDGAPGFKEVFLGNSPKPRLSIGIGVNWVSPFGPLRLDIAKALIKQKGDDTKLFSFNVGTQF